MTRRRAGFLLAPGLLLVPLVAAVSAVAQGPPMPTPGPAHEVLKAEVGTWDATVEIFGVPGDAPKSKGVEIATLGCGGLCLITDFKGEMMPGVAFHGHGTTAYDSAKQKYVGSWTDSLSSGLLVTEATWDPATSTMNATMDGPDMTGRIVKMRTTTVHKEGTRVFTMFEPGPDGKEAMSMRITYTRRP